MKECVAAGLVALCIMAALPAAGQGTQAPRDHAAADAVREAARVDKRGLVERNMELTGKEAKAFWPLYDEYQKDLDRIVKRQNRAVLDYVNATSNMTEENARRIAREVVAADVEEVRLREKSLRRFSSVLPAKKAVRYIQIENKLRALNRFDMAEKIPLVR